MPRPKGSKNKRKNNNLLETQIAQKQAAASALSSDIEKISNDLAVLRAKMRAKKSELRKLDREVEKMAEKAEKAKKKAEAERMVRELLEDGMTPDDIIECLR